MKKLIVNSQNAPKAIGPYSQAVRVGNLVFTSGQLSIDPKTNEFINDSVEGQTERVLKNLGEVLKESGCDLASVVKTTVFLKEMNDFQAMNAVYGKFFGQKPPARSTVAVAALPKGAKVEIEAVALLEED